jgi:hypothetical protein
LAAWVGVGSPADGQVVNPLATVARNSFSLKQFEPTSKPEEERGRTTRHICTIPDAKITTMKNGLTHLADKAEQAIDLEGP